MLVEADLPVGRRKILLPFFFSFCAEQVFEDFSKVSHICFTCQCYRHFYSFHTTITEMDECQPTPLQLSFSFFSVFCFISYASICFYQSSSECANSGFPFPTSLSFSAQQHKGFGMLLLLENLNYFPIKHPNHLLR